MYVCMYVCLYTTGSFIVVDTDTLEEKATYNHRKEEISDVKFSPSMHL